MLAVRLERVWPDRRRGYGEYHYWPLKGHRGNWYEPTTIGGWPLPRWLVLESDGRHLMTQTSYHPRSWPMLVTGDPDWQDYRVTARVRPLSFQGPCGIVARYQDSRNFYAFGFDGGGTKVQVTRRTHEGLTVLAEALDLTGDRREGYAFVRPPPGLLAPTAERAPIGQAVVQGWGTAVAPASPPAPCSLPPRVARDRRKLTRHSSQPRAVRMSGHCRWPDQSGQKKANVRDWELAGIRPARRRRPPSAQFPVACPGGGCPSAGAAATLATATGRAAGLRKRRSSIRQTQSSPKATA